MKALIDGDILRYEIGFGAETAWSGITKGAETVPDFDLVMDLLKSRLNEIMEATKADSYQIYYTEGPTFRYDLAVTKPYKGNRKDQDKPWHFDNLTAYMRDVLGAEAVMNIEADDRLSIEHVKDADTIICSRDKDLRQVPGWFYSWELGKQPSFGPVYIDTVGSLDLDRDKKPPKLSGTGLAFFYAQCLMGDTTDNIPGLPKYGAVAAYDTLSHYIEGNDLVETKSMLMNMAVIEKYEAVYGHEWEEKLLEQGRLLWMTRRLHEDGSPVLWEIGMEE